MKKNTVILFCLFLLITSNLRLIAQKDFSEDERIDIAKNIEILIGNFASSLQFNIKLPESTIQRINKQLSTIKDSIFSQHQIDSLRLVKIESEKQIVRDSLKQRFLKNFIQQNNQPENTLLNFAFDSIINPNEEVTLRFFVDNYFGLYSNVDGNFKINFLSKNGYIESLIPYLKSAPINVNTNSSSVIVPFSITRIEGFYDTLSTHYINLPPDIKNAIKTNQSFSSTTRMIRIDLAAAISFKKVNDLNSYRINSVISQKKVLAYPELQAFLRDKIIKHFNLYNRLNLQGREPDSTLIPDFLSSFENPNKNALDCQLFFNDSVCKQSKDEKDFKDITPVQYCKNVINNYKYISVFSSDLDEKSFQLKKEKNFIIVKWPAMLRFIPRDFNDNVPKGIGKDTLINFYFKVDYSKKGLFKPIESYKNPRITDIAAYEKPITIIQPAKKGDFSFSVLYNPMYYQFQIDNNSAFQQFNSEFHISHGFGIDAGYYWFGNTEHTYYGFSSGLHYEMLQTGMYLDSTYYFTKPDEIPMGDENVADYEERVWIKDFRQTIRFDLITIPVMFNYMKQLQTKTLFNLGIGTEISIVNKNGVSLIQDSGSSTHKGWYVMSFPNEPNGEYLIENVEEYGYVTDKTANIWEANRQLSSTLMYVSVAPSYSIPVSVKNPNLYLQLGINIKLGLNPLYEASGENDHIMDSPGKSNAIFSSGVKKNCFVFGFSIGLRYFNSVSQQEEKTFKF